MDSTPSVTPPQIKANGHDSAAITGEAVSQIDSDAESDMDPATMTDKYIELQTQLYDLQPELGTAGAQGLVNGKSRSRSIPAKHVQPQVARLLRRLEHLKADILFDRYDAEQKWTEKHNQLAKAAAERRRLHLDEKPRSDTKSPSDLDNVISATGTVEKPSDQSADEDGVEALGDFFSGLPDYSNNGEDGVPNRDIEGSSHRPMTVRDFGKWNGVNPRRTFEETCKARSVLLQLYTTNG